MIIPIILQSKQPKILMTLQIVSPDKSSIDDIANFLLNERLVAHAIISENIIYKEKNKEGKIITSNQYLL